MKPRVGHTSLWAWSGQSPGWLVTSCPSRTIARPSQACPVPRASWSGQGLAGRGASGNREGRIGGLHSPGPCPAGLVTSEAVSLPCGHSAGQACPLPWLEPPPRPAAAWAAASCRDWSLARTRLCTAVTCPRLCEPSPRSPRTCISLLRGPGPPVAAPPPRSGPRASGIGSTCGFVTSAQSPASHSDEVGICAFRSPGRSVGQSAGHRLPGRMGPPPALHSVFPHEQGEGLRCQGHTSSPAPHRQGVGELICPGFRLLGPTLASPHQLCSCRRVANPLCFCLSGRGW